MNDEKCLNCWKHAMDLVEQARQDERQKCIPSEEEIEVFLIENKICGMRMENIVKVIHNWLEGRRP